MKKKEVPQDNEGLHEGKFRDLCYAVDEDGNYVTVHSTGWTPKNAAMQQALEKIHEDVEVTRQKVIAGELSMLAYFMKKNIMDLKLLAQYTGIPKRKLKKHMKPEKFQLLDRKVLGKYAEVFNITIEELINISGLEEAK